YLVKVPEHAGSTMGHVIIHFAVGLLGALSPLALTRYKFNDPMSRDFEALDGFGHVRCIASGVRQFVSRIGVDVQDVHETRSRTGRSPASSKRSSSHRSLASEQVTNCAPMFLRLFRCFVKCSNIGSSASVLWSGPVLLFVNSSMWKKSMRYCV